MHPLVWVVVPMLAAYALVENVGYLRTGMWGHAKKLPLAGPIFYVLVGSVFVLWVARFFGACGGPVPV